MTRGVDVVEVIRTQLGAPVSVIVSGTPPAPPPNASTDDVEANLDRLVADQAYRWRSIRGRYVLYPDEEAWEKTVSGVAIRDVPRPDAATAYVAEARRQVPELERLLAGGIKGDPRAAVYSDRVSLSAQASVLEHLVELLGDDPQLTFVVEPGGEDRLILRFERAGAEAGDQ